MLTRTGQGWDNTLQLLPGVGERASNLLKLLFSPSETSLYISMGTGPQHFPISTWMFEWGGEQQIQREQRECYSRRRSQPHHPKCELHLLKLAEKPASNKSHPILFSCQAINSGQPAASYHSLSARSVAWLPFITRWLFCWFRKMWF